MLNISGAALFAATLNLNAVPAIGFVPAFAQETPAPTPAFAMTITIPTVTAVGSSMSEQQIKDVFTSNFLTHADALARLSADSITIPEITLSFTASDSGPAYTSTATYRDLVLSNIKDGRVAAITIRSTESKSSDGTTVYNQINGNNFDIRRTLEVAGIVTGDPNATMAPMYGDFTIAGGTLSGPMFSCAIGGSRNTGFEARPVKVSFASLLDALEQFGATPGRRPAAGGHQDFRQLHHRHRARHPRRCGGQRLGGRLFGYAGGWSERGRQARRRLDGRLRAEHLPRDQAQRHQRRRCRRPGARFTRRIRAQGHRLQPDPDGAGWRYRRPLSEDWFNKNGRLLIPSMAGLAFSGVDLDVPNPDKPGERIQAKIGNFIEPCRLS